MSENKFYWNWSRIVDVALIVGAVYLASTDKDGWGWLMLLFFLKNNL